MTTEPHHHDHDGHDHSHISEERSKYQQMFDKYDLHLHDELVQEDVKKMLKEHKDENNTLDVKKFLFSCIELTSLKVTDSEDTILHLVERVNNFTDANPDFPHPAAICVYPRFVQIVSKSLEADGIEITAVTGGFPSSQTFPEVKTVETALALKDGATEIDTVLPVGYFLSEDYETVSDEINEIKETCGEETTLKVILETGALQSATNIKKAALMAMYSGANFVKTSTGKVEPAATPAAAYVMCQAIKEYYDKTGNKVGIKVAGGIHTTEQALDYYTIVKETLGNDWLIPAWFRIGASSLANNLLSDILGKNVKPF